MVLPVKASVTEWLVPSTLVTLLVILTAKSGLQDVLELGGCWCELPVVAGAAILPQYCLTPVPWQKSPGLSLLVPGPVLLRVAPPGEDSLGRCHRLVVDGLLSPQPPVC